MAQIACNDKLVPTNRGTDVNQEIALPPTGTLQGSGGKHGLDVNELRWTTYWEVNAISQPLYAGDCAPGGNTGSPVFRIRKWTYDANGAVLTEKWASGTTDATLIWTSRASYAYS